ncbi:Mannan endo-1 like protein [Verticillium longisporum]|uniref:Mannan endo-1 like protein n=1 Tax=Verticillium longisporum TaxID=100787 RepID=A0A8I2ZIM2_VERLO|nr:Mannan endo-1 like protein [Verticillium longisporum]
MAPLNLAVLALSSVAANVLATATIPKHETYCPVFINATNAPLDCDPSRTVSFIDYPLPLVQSVNDSEIDTEALEYAFEALTVMQSDFFMPAQGTWPEAIDWTVAVMETMLSGMLTTLSQAFSAIDFLRKDDKGSERNLIDSYFTQLVASYFGQDDVAIRHQAYDDILWVALGWVDAMKFVHVHSTLHYPPRDPSSIVNEDLGDALRKSPWYGHFWVPAFAHRARIFWDSASRGWDNNLCGGGMVWDPRLAPYKNAVTNELWIAASVSMYLWFPGDNNTAPWINGRFQLGATREPKYLAAAIEGYKWLVNVNMRNEDGLFVDGFHISRPQGDKKCDARSEMVFTYNQGILLTGQRGLWTATGSPSYLEDGHRLIQSVIKASGWDLRHDKPVDDLRKLAYGRLPLWRGLGRGGVLEDGCDASGTCSQDGQTFKGIFFHHFVTFCEAIQPPDPGQNMKIDYEAHDRITTAHRTACRSYSGWVAHNARAALLARDDEGRFGAWWGAGLFNNVLPTVETDGVPHDEPNATDYRNHGIPHEPLWAKGNPDEIWAPNGEAHRPPGKGSSMTAPAQSDQMVMGSTDGLPLDTRQELGKRHKTSTTRDPNDRGRGRTAETQNGGMALMRAWWELVACDHDLHPES